MSARAIKLPIDDCGITVRVGTDGVWLEFKSGAGKEACIHVFNVLRNGHIIGSAITEWCLDREKQAEQLRAKELPL